MSPYLRAALLCFGISAILLALAAVEACQHYAVFGACRHESTYAASVMGERHPVRVWVGDWFGGYHCKAQAFIGNEWMWLCVDYPEVYPCLEGDKGFKPQYVYKPKIWMHGIGWQLKE